jgi:cytochrome c oxidase assembly protein Cox11
VRRCRRNRRRLSAETASGALIDSEEREFVVRFIVDPDLPTQVDRMTLAYSMYALPAQKVAAR